MDQVVSDYEVALVAIVNRNSKSLVLGLGSWVLGRQDGLASAVDQCCDICEAVWGFLYP